MYLSIGTRPDISFAVNRASRYLESHEVKRIIKYLKGTVKLGLKFEPYQDNHLKAYSDADYAGELESRRSTTGYVLQWGSSTLTWNSQKQSIIALSTTDAEYMAACQTVKEIMWLKRLIKELNNSEPARTTLFVDNQSALDLIKNPVHHKRTKHIDIRFHYIRERYQDNEFILQFLKSTDQTADILTKPLSRQLFQYHRNSMCCDFHGDDEKC